MSTSSTGRRSRGLMLPSPAWGVLVLSASVLVWSDAALAQDLVALSPEIHTYDSPLVLEYSLDEVLLTGGAPWIKGIASHVCRGVSIQKMQVRVGRYGQEKHQSVLGHVFVNNNSGKDKKVALTHGILVDDSDQVLTTAMDKTFDVEVGHTTRRELRVPLPVDLLPGDVQFYGPNKAELKHRFRLRITLTLQDD